MNPDDYCLCHEAERTIDGGNPGLLLIFTLLYVLFWGGVIIVVWKAGVHAGRKQMAAEYAAEIRRLDVATRPEQVKAWLIQGRQK